MLSAEALRENHTNAEDNVRSGMETIFHSRWQPLKEV